MRSYMLRRRRHLFINRHLYSRRHPSTLISYCFPKQPFFPSRFSREWEGELRIRELFNEPLVFYSCFSSSRLEERKKREGQRSCDRKARKRDRGQVGNGRSGWRPPERYWSSPLSLNIYYPLYRGCWLFFFLLAAAERWCNQIRMT